MRDLAAIAGPLHIVFLLLPQFSLIAFTSAVEPLRVANELAGKTVYRWSVASLDGLPVISGNRLSFTPDITLYNALHCDLLLVCGGLDIHKAVNQTLVAALRKLGARLRLGALCTGTYALAKADLLTGYRCTIHWENAASLREEFPGLIVSSALFEIDRDRYTCAGGIAPLDMMLHLIGHQHGPQLARGISEALIRDRHDRQRIPLRLRLGTSQPTLIEAVSLMEANLDELISLDELAERTGISRRQLERLFRKHLDCAPGRYYLDLRLARARELLLQTTLPMAEVALACGFTAAAHFSTCYREAFGLSPREERQQGNRPGAPVTAVRGEFYGIQALA